MYRQHYPDDPGMHNMAPGTYGQGDRYTRVTYRDNPSFCSRVRDSLIGILVGLVLLVAASGMLFYNEGRAVQTAKSLEEGLAHVISLPSIEVVFDNNQHKLIHFSGSLATGKALYDAEYGVQVNAVKLRRKVEMFQWIEEESTRTINEGERTRTETTYSYHKGWRSDLVRSSSFATPMGHHNPDTFSVNPMLYQADRVTVGAFSLSSELVGKITNFVPHRPTASASNAQLHDGAFYHGNDPRSPQVGDIRVMFESAGRSDIGGGGQGEMVSVIGQQTGHTISHYETQAGDPLLLLYMGDHSAKSMFGNEQAQNTMLTWGMRFGGWLLMFIGFQCLTSIITTLVSWLPIVREIVSLGVTLMCASLSISLSLTVIAIGWITYRPWLGTAILIAAITPFILSKVHAMYSSRQEPEYRRSRYYED